MGQGGDAIDPQEQREEIFERAKQGEITGAQADEEAIRLGLGSFSHQPGPDEFRPEAQAWWTLAMAVAWIAYLDFDEVREWSAPFREQSYDWHWQRWRIGFEGPIHEGWQLSQRSPPTLALLSIAASYHQATGEKALAMPIAEAREALWIALRTDCFRANAIDALTGERCEIVPMEWLELEYVQQHDRDEVRTDSLSLEGTRRYRDVLCPSASLRGLWHKPRTPAVLTLPMIEAPTSDGYMPLTSAAQWIATEGNVSDFAADDSARWAPAFKALLSAIGAGKVRVIGTREGNREPVEPYHFVDCPVVLPYESDDLELVFGTTLHLKTYTVDSEEEWRGTFNDSLVRHGSAVWSRLVVSNEDVNRLWPFETPEPPKSGTPGRPTSSHLFFAEMERRALLKILEGSVSAESRYLSEWLAVHHANMPQAKPKAVEQSIRDRYWVLRRQK